VNDERFQKGFGDVKRACIDDGLGNPPCGLGTALGGVVAERLLMKEWIVRSASAKDTADSLRMLANRPPSLLSQLRRTTFALARQP
jgi:hypothetical protein